MLGVALLSVVMMNIMMLNVFMRNVVVLSVFAPIYSADPSIESRRRSILRRSQEAIFVEATSDSNFGAKIIKVGIFSHVRPICEQAVSDQDP
jgi:hypothetical protein